MIDEDASEIVKNSGKNDTGSRKRARDDAPPSKQYKSHKRRRGDTSTDSRCEIEQTATAPSRDVQQAIAEAKHDLTVVNAAVTLGRHTVERVDAEAKKAESAFKEISTLSSGLMAELSALNRFHKNFRAFCRRETPFLHVHGHQNLRAEREDVLLSLRNPVPQAPSQEASRPEDLNSILSLAESLMCGHMKVLEDLGGKGALENATERVRQATQKLESEREQLRMHREREVMLTEKLAILECKNF